MKDIDKNTKLDKLSITILIISGGLILFSFFAPIIFIQKSAFGITFNGTTGAIGDTIGGIMNPFIAISGVFLTFLAFYIQFEANKLHRKLFRQELDYNKFENQFYEMLKLHKENVNEIQIDELILYVKTSENGDKEIDRADKTINGRKTFKYLKSEFEIIYEIAKKHFPDEEPKVWINKAYGIFFSGISKYYSQDGISSQDRQFFTEVMKVKTIHKDKNYTSLPETLKDYINKIHVEDNLRYNLFEGYSSELAHYYRHLFQTVKFVVNQREEMLSYNEKRKYLRILRAQLSNQEQAMLFYNWLSDFGSQWNNKKNKFFTDYRMIHNIYQDLIVDEVKLDKLFNLNSGYLKEENRDFDPLFEFQDWK